MNQQNNPNKRLMLSLLAFPILSLGIALQVKAGIGQSLLNALSLVLADLTGVTIGTMLNLINLLCFVTFISLRRQGIHLKDAIQLAAVLTNGFLINHLLTGGLLWLHLDWYGLKVLIFLLGLTLSSISLGLILALESIQFPLESLSLLVSKRTSTSLTQVRYAFDLFFLLTTLLLTLIFKEPLFIREGTLISLIFLSKLMGQSYEYFKKVL